MADHDQTALDIVLDAVASVALRAQILYMKVQPPAGRTDIERVLCERGFVLSDLPAAPAATVLVDLRRTPEELLAGMRATARKHVRRAIRDGIDIRPAGHGGLAAFRELMAKAGKRIEGFVQYPPDYYAAILRQFGPRAELLLAERDGEVLSGELIIGYGETVIDKVAAWSGEHANLSPNELLQWRAMQWARDQGYRYYDLEGISESVAQAIVAGDGVPESGRRGPTNFKLGLGGDVVLLPRAYDRSFHTLLVWPARIVAPRLSRAQSWAHRLQGRAPSE
jgi:lipid II:glycine glycyltransferase (peptidoglycan interpeptide bridge formation enzyme)